MVPNVLRLVGEDIDNTGNAANVCLSILTVPSDSGHSSIDSEQRQWKLALLHWERSEWGWRRALETRRRGPSARIPRGSR